jgi:glycosyltransferase involved in cell wall biosynthesis
VPERLAIVPNCLDLDRFVPSEQDGVAHVLSVGRLTVRKGLDDVIALSSSLRDLEGRVELDVIGAPSLWSDYSGLLTQLDPGVGRALGRLDRDEVARLLAASRCLLQLSRYEPFGLTVAEALACGVPVVVTAAVGAAEGLPADVARVVEAGDVAGADRVIRELLALEPDERAFLAARCRAEARRFAPEVVAAALEAELRTAAQSKVS